MSTKMKFILALLVVWSGQTLAATNPQAQKAEPDPWALVDPKEEMEGIRKREFSRDSQGLQRSTQQKKVEVKAGDQIEISGWHWVELDREMKTSSSIFYEGDPCEILQGGKIKVEKIDSKKDEVKLKYEIKNPQQGSPCPNGASFSLPLQDVEYFKSLQSNKKAEAKRG